MEAGTIFVDLGQAIHLGWEEHCSEKSLLSVSEICPLFSKALSALLILVLTLDVGSFLSLVYVYSSSILFIFRTYSEWSITTITLPLPYEKMTMS